MFLVNMLKPYTHPETGVHFLRREERRNGGKVLIQHCFRANMLWTQNHSFTYAVCKDDFEQ